MSLYEGRDSSKRSTGTVAQGEAQGVEEAPAASTKFQNVGRNDPCPCGSGKNSRIATGKYVIRFEKVESRLADVFVQSTFVCKKKERRNFNGNRRYSESIDPDE